MVTVRAETPPEGRLQHSALGKGPGVELVSGGAQGAAPHRLGRLVNGTTSFLRAGPQLSYRVP